MRREQRPSPASTPSWHPDTDVEPTDPGQFPAAVPATNPPNRRPLTIAAVVAATVFAAGGVVWLTTRGDDNATPAAELTSTSAPSSTTKTTTSPAPAPRDPAAETTLRGLLPAGYAPGSCVATDPTAPARATFTCSVNRDAGGPTAAQYSLMPSQDALQREFNKLVADSATVICPGNIMSPGAWRHNATPDLVAGTVFCATKGTEQLVAWTTDDTLLLNVTRSADGSPTLEQLFAWWGTHS